MGIVWSMGEIISSSIVTEEVKEMDSQGNTIKLAKKKNPFVSAVIVVSATTIILVYLDKGSGMLTKIFGKRCIECSNVVK